MLQHAKKMSQNITCAVGPVSAVSIKQIVMLGLLVLACVIFASHVHASVGSGGGLPYEDGLTSLRSSVTGPVAFTLSIVGIVVAGSILIFGGDLSGFFKTLLFLILVISLLVGAQNTMSSFFGRGAEIAGLVAPLTFLGMA